MKHTTELLEVIAFTSDEKTKRDSAYIKSRTISENIVPSIIRSLKLLNEKGHRNHVLFLEDPNKSYSFSILCGLAPSKLSNYDTICIEVYPGRHLIIKGKPDKVGKFYEDSNP